MRTLLRLLFVFALLLALNACLFSQVKIHVTPPPLVMDTTPVEMTITAGNGFVIGASYQGGTPPFTCALTPTPVVSGTPAPVPTWVRVDGSIQGNGSSAAGDCTVTADAVPLVTGTTTYLFTVVVTDAKGKTSSDNIIIDAAP